MVATASSHKFQKGVSGNPAGKPKGLKEKIRLNVGQIMKDNNFDPVIQLIKIAKNKKCGFSVRREACSDLLSYVAPKLKAIEITASEVGERFQMHMSFGTPKEGEETAKDVVDNISSEQDCE